MARTTAVGALGVDLSLNSAAFIRDAGKSQKALASNSARMIKDLRKVDRGFTKVLRSVKRTAKGMISMRGVMAGVAGAAGIGLMVKKSIDFADAIGKTADAIGISTATLQEWRFAMDISGVATEKTDKGLKKFVRNMGELARSSSETQTALKDLDPALLSNLRSLNSVEDQLDLSARAVASYTNQAKRAAVAQALFGRAGVDMTVGLKDGAAAFDALLQKARSLGIVLEEKLIRNAEAAKNELTILAQVIKVKLVAAVVAFAPQIADLATAFADAIPDIVKAAEAFAKFIGLIERAPVGNLANIAKEMAEIRHEFDRMDDLMADPAFMPTKRQVARIEELLERLKLLRAAQSDLIRESAGVPTTSAPPKPGAPTPPPGLPAVRPNRFRLAHEDEDFIRGMEQAARVRRELATTEFNTAEAIRRTTEEMKRQADQTAVLITATRQGADALRAQQEIFELQNAALAQGVDLTTKQGLAWEAAFRSTQIFNKGLEETQRQMDETARQSERLADDITFFLDDVIGGLARGESAWESFRNAAVFALREIQREVLRTFVKRAISGDEGGFGVGSILGGIFNTSGGTRGPQFTGTGLEGLAASGSFAHGGRAVVGGAGGTDSKLAVLKVTPREDITVRTPQQQKDARGGGFTFNDNSVISIDARGADAGVDRKIRKAMEQTQSATVAKVRDLVERGGRFSSSFGV